MTKLLQKTLLGTLLITGTYLSAIEIDNVQLKIENTVKEVNNSTSKDNGYTLGIKIYNDFSTKHKLEYFISANRFQSDNQINEYSGELGLQRKVTEKIKLGVAYVYSMDEDNKVYTGTGFKGNLEYGFTDNISVTVNYDRIDRDYKNSTPNIKIDTTTFGILFEI
jgi:opacity protein-like surface antigen